MADDAHESRYDKSLGLLAARFIQHIKALRQDVIDLKEVAGLRRRAATPLARPCAPPRSRARMQSIIISSVHRRACVAAGRCRAAGARGR